MRRPRTEGQVSPIVQTQRSERVSEASCGRAPASVRGSSFRGGALGSPPEPRARKHAHATLRVTVVEVQGQGLIVEFDRWGRVAVPRAYLERQVSPGVVGGLQHAYALITHSAQGHTFAGASPLPSDASSVEGAYVGITRAQFDLQAVVIRRRDLSLPIADDVLPVLRDKTSALLATSRRLQGIGPERLASELKVVRSQDDDEVAPTRQATKQKEDEIEAEPSEARPSVQNSQFLARRATQSIEERLVIETDRAVAVPSGQTIGPQRAEAGRMVRDEGEGRVEADPRRGPARQPEQQPSQSARTGGFSQSARSMNRPNQAGRWSGAGQPARTGGP